MQLRRVYCIVVTYNGMQWIERCLNSLISNPFNRHIIVIDNGSTDATVSFIKENFATVQLIEAGRNLGFGQANNIGLRMALKDNADSIFLLNQDAWIEPDTISKLAQAHMENPDFGILSPIHMDGQGNELDNYFYDYLLQSDIKELITAAIVNKESQVKIIETKFVNAAAWLISNDCLKRTGEFDPVFFHYGEDNNYVHRAIFKGFKIGILPTTRIYHDRNRLPANASLDIKSKFKKDWIQLLVQACNIQHYNYKNLIFRRFIKCSFLIILSVLTFNRENLLYNFSMVKKITLSFFKIRNSRRTSLR